MVADANTTPAKKTRARKTVEPAEVAKTDVPQRSETKTVKSTTQDIFTDLVNKISQSKIEFEALQKEITEMRLAWVKEQQVHDHLLLERNQQEELTKRREQEAYIYETNRSRKLSEDEFNDKKTKWEKELEAKKEELEQDKKELEELRKQAVGFETEKIKAVKDASILLQKELTEKYTHETVLREQEFKSEKAIFSLKIENLSSENTRLVSEVNTLKKALDETTKQLKDVAVKVIESTSNSSMLNTKPFVATQE